jgi:hypothetical protein
MFEKNSKFFKAAECNKFFSDDKLGECGVTGNLYCSVYIQKTNKSKQT